MKEKSSMRLIKNIGIFVCLICFISFNFVGCGGKRTGEKTLEVKDFKLGYTHKADGGPEVSEIELQHPFKISEKQLLRQMARLYYENYALLGEEGRIFTKKDMLRMKRLLTKALNSARKENIITFDVNSEEGNTVGILFASNGNLNWRFQEIRGVKYSLTRNRIARYGTAWRLVPKKGQKYHTTSKLLGAKQETNWIISKLGPTKKRYRVIKKRPASQVQDGSTSSPTSPTLKDSGTPSTSPTIDPKLEEKLRFLKQLYQDQLIDEEEYQKKRKDLLDQYL